MPVRTLIVDDSPTMQNLIAAVLTSDPQIEVVGKASSAMQAREMIKELDPDVITLDVEMPGMDGLEFLTRLMKLRPTPVVMISSWTREGADASIAALSVGAFACHPKPRMDNEAELREICETVKLAAHSRATIASRSGDQNTSAISETTKPTSNEAYTRRSTKKVVDISQIDLIAIGSSTGGVEALTKLLSNFPTDCPPVVVTQHMPKAFTSSFAQRLDRTCPPKVTELQGSSQLKTGHVFLAPGNIGHLHVSGTKILKASIVEGKPVTGHIPSVDVMFESISNIRSIRAVGILLTGMGSDGAKGMLKMKNAGAVTISQSEKSCLVYGMPAAAEKLGASQHVVDLDKISNAIFQNNAKVNQYVSA